LRARPEPTQLEHLLDASFLGKLLVLPANVRLDWKVIARYKHSSLLGLVVSDKGKSFIKLTPGNTFDAMTLGTMTFSILGVQLHYCLLNAKSGSIMTQSAGVVLGITHMFC
jgi:hypothetical protein